MKRTTVRLLLGALLLSGLQLVTTAGPAQSAVTPGPAYLTLLMARSQWVPTKNTCVPIPGGVTLEKVAQDLKARGLSATGSVVVDRTEESTRQCEGYTLQASWDDLKILKATYGWEFISHGMTHGHVAQMTPAEQYAETCGSLPYFTNHGFDRAWGLFAYGGGPAPLDVQTNVVSNCFAYGRKYKTDSVNVKSKTKAPWFQFTNSITGGACNLVGDPCKAIKTISHLYPSPASLAKLMSPTADQWSVVQMYRFVSGTNLSGAYRWDCTSPDWRQHWTSVGELYCENDYLAAVDQIPAGVVVTDPATVATAWGRVPPFQP